MRSWQMTFISAALVVAGLFVTSGTAAAKTDPANLPHLGTCPRMQVGSRGLCVEELQRTLRKVGLNVDQDGIFGQQTKGGVIAFQSQENLAKDGIVGPQTNAALIRVANSPEPARSFRGCPQLAVGTSTPCVTRFVGEFNNIVANQDPHLSRGPVYTAQMADGVRDYQRRNNLVVDGVVGRQTADLLDVQAGPNQVCFAMKDAGQVTSCGRNGAADGDGKSVWSCVKDIFGLDTLQEIALDHDPGYQYVKSRSGFLRILGKVTSTPARGAVCVMFG